jgi:murein DD-endopeptidase MepM/ murein hydrolase activator NlpD
VKARHLGLAIATGLAVIAPALPAQAATTGKVAAIGIVKTGGTALKMRRTPSSAATMMGTVANGGKVWIMCQTTGDQIAGVVRATNLWDRLANNTFVADAYVTRDAAVKIPVCAPETVPAPTPTPTPTPAPAIPPASGDWQLPVAAGLVSGFRTPTRPTHDGVDLGAARNTPIQAAAAGTVVRVTCNVSAGTCDVDGNRTLKGCGWYVEVQHAGNIVTRYCHMVRKPSVVVGQTVRKGQLLGYVGTSGSSSGPHLHFEVHVNAPPATSANAVSPIAFMATHHLTIK